MKIITYNTLLKLYRFFNNCDNFVFLDTSKPDEENHRSLLFVDPVDRLSFYEGESEVEFLKKIQEYQRNGNYIAGWFGYEFGYLFEQSLKDKLSRLEDKGALLADLGVFKKSYEFDHQTGECDFPLPELPAELSGYNVSNLRTSQEEEEYIGALEKILEYIEAGDTYQVNYTLKLLFDFQGSSEKFYDDLRRNQSVGYGAYIRFGEKRVLSFSPELFFRKNEADVVVRPMKGTLKRGKNLTEDEERKNFLRTDIKNQSENVMIVDLLRNDLGCLMHHLDQGDVRVNSLFDVEAYETLLQMTSTITGKTAREVLEKVSLPPFLKAIFPCGSVTGAPKIRTMEIIDELEKERRGVYTGAIGCMFPDGTAVFNVPIRTVVLNGNKGEMGIGSGIVHDSVPHQEWKECLLKGKFLTEPQKKFQLIETIFYGSDTGFLYLDEHLQRLKDSADYFLYQVDLAYVREQLEQYVQNIDTPSWRVRLTLEKDGSLDIQKMEWVEPSTLVLPPYPSEERDLPRAGLSAQKIDSTSLWLYHKTTNREIYDREFARARNEGLFDVLFVNEHGFVTEGCVTNVFVFKDNCYYTPPEDDGLLPGVMRKKVIADNGERVKEQSLTLEDLRQADAIFLCNSVRGIVQVQFNG